MKKEYNELSFQQWLNSLSYTELEDSMAFTLRDSEYELFQDMVQKQPPPPTPIHARAIGYTSQVGATDGRNPVERERRDRLKRPRLFQLVGGCGVMARQFCLPDGTQLSLGCTAEQREADESLLLGTLIDVRTDKKYMCTCRFALVDNRPSTRLKRRLLRILKVTSRGQFASGKSAPSAASQCSSWLKMTQRWFSLSMYLSACFEAALFSAFSKGKKSLEVARAWNGVDMISEGTLWFAMQQSAATTIRELVLCPSNLVQLESSELAYILQIQSVQFNFLKVKKPSARVLLKSMEVCHVTEIGSPIYTLKQSLCKNLQKYISAEAERAFLIELEETTDAAGKSDRKGGDLVKKITKKKKKKRTRMPSNTIVEEADEENKESLSGDEFCATNDQEGRSRFNGCDYSLPDNDTSAKERSRNVVYVLSILNHVVQDVFLRVGLPFTPPSSASQFSNRPQKEVAPKRFPTTKETCKEKIQSKFSPLPNKIALAIKDNVLDPRSSKESSPIIAPKAATSEQRPPPIITEGSNWPMLTPKEAERTADRDVWPLYNEDPAAGQFSIIDASSRLGQNRPSPDSTGIPFRPQNGSFPQHCGPYYGGYIQKAEGNGLVWEVSDAALDDWVLRRGFAGREESLLAGFFPNPARAVDSSFHGDQVASSTAASIASSIQEPESDPDVDRSDDDDLADEGNTEDNPEATAIKLQEIVDPFLVSTDANNDAQQVSGVSPSLHQSTSSPSCSPVLVSLADLKAMRKGTSYSDLRSLLSRRSTSSVTATSLPSSPHQHGKPPKASPHDDLRNVERAEAEHRIVKKSLRSSHPVTYRAAARLVKSRDDHDLHRGRNSTDVLYRLTVMKSKMSKDDHDIRPNRVGLRSTEMLSYRNVAARLSVKSVGSPRVSAIEGLSTLPVHLHLKRTTSHGPSMRQEMCVRSVNALDANNDSFHSTDRRRISSTDDGDNFTVTKDGSTTITSALSHRESEEMVSLREERNAYRDMCLTLGAEVAKLKNMLAAQRGASSVNANNFLGHIRGVPMHSGGEFFFDRESVSHSFGSVPKARTLAAMSDAGFQRGDHESLASEDTGARLLSESLWNNAQGATVAVAGSVGLASEHSIDHESRTHTMLLPGCNPVSKELFDPVSLNGMQSRLSQDIHKFLENIHLQLKKQSNVRQIAVQRMTRLVNTLWPRAQVKLYGSHVTHLCLPSSDVDFVICLPAVHKKAVAVAPGVLEGRNAINETSQKLLSRKLKGESWIDPRSMKLIERTVVPVIKVSTKDSRARTLQLDITFDAPGHHGIEAVAMVSKILEELPMIRPLVLVLKQFLLNRALLTAYTGGLSSYCLFLMVARYLQEQPSAWGDCGALLVGFLDFFGNHFDPRTTGISVRRREYFARPNYAVSRVQSVAQPIPQPTVPWNPQPYASQPIGTQFYRRNSFNDKGCGEMLRGGSPATRPYRFTNLQLPPQNYIPASSVPMPPANVNDQNIVEHRMSNTFDPLWVEDPLSEGNNVGRNAFRYLQVQRAFSDAHRALAASLEWDMASASDMIQENADYPLLQCLLQSEDRVFDL
jgi:DNA polymerase sigma